MEEGIEPVLRFRTSGSRVVVRWGSGREIKEWYAKTGGGGSGIKLEERGDEYATVEEIVELWNSLACEEEKINASTYKLSEIIDMQVHFMI